MSFFHQLSAQVGNIKKLKNQNIFSITIFSFFSNFKFQCCFHKIVKKAFLNDFQKSKNSFKTKTQPHFSCVGVASSLVDGFFWDLKYPLVTKIMGPG